MDATNTSSGQSRREFLTTAAVITGTLMTTHAASAQRLVVRGKRAMLPAQAFLREPMAAVDLRGLATRAVEAAMQAGASYADVRVGEQQQLQLIPYWLEPNAYIATNFSYGVRTLVDGAWALIHGREPSADAMTTAARDAVAMARGYAALVARRAELAPATVTTGEWSTPIKQDPFSVPLREHSAMMDGYAQLHQRYPEIYHLPGFQFAWSRERRVFASSEGMLVTQTLGGAYPVVGASSPGLFTPWFSLRFPLIAASGGYETVGHFSQYAEDYKAFVDDIRRYTRMPVRTLDVGRYPVVMDGSTFGATFGQTTGVALELDRVLGYEADASGTSYLTPPLELLGTRIVSPLLTVTATRAVPTSSAAKWDDEGVESHDYPVIQAGHLVDYHTSRATAPALRPWYERRGVPYRAHGCVSAAEGGDVPMVRAPHLTLDAAPQRASLDTLCKDVSEGVLLVGIPDCLPDQQFASSTVNAPLSNRNLGLVLKIERGKIVGVVVGNVLDLNVKRLWKEQLVALGDASTVQQTDFEVQKGMPWQMARQSTAAPAALFKDVDITTIKRPT
jgi:TldD protein